MNNTVQILIELRKKGGEVLGNIEGGLRKINSIGKAYRDTLSSTNSAASQLTGTLTRLVGVIGGVELYRRAITSAFQFNDTVQQSRIGLAALIRSFNDFKDAQGQTVSAAEAYTLSMKMAEQMQRRLQIAGLETTATYEQLLKVLQEGLGPAFKRGFNPDQVVEFVTLMAQAGAALSVPMDQLGQEVRAMLDGTIDQNARIAQALNVTAEKIKELAKTGEVFPYLKDRLKEFEIAGRDAAKTFSGAASNLYDAVQVALGKGLETSFNQTTSLLLRLQDAIVTIDKTAGTITFNERIVAALKRVDDAIVQIFGSTGDLNDWVGRLADAFANVAVAALQVVSVFLKIMDALGPMLPTLISVITYAGLFKLAWSAVIGTLILVPTHVLAIVNGIKALMAVAVLPWLASLKTALAAASAAAVLSATAFRVTLAGAAIFAVQQIYSLASALYEWRKAALAAKQAQADLSEAQEFSGSKMAAKLDQVSKTTGIAIKDMQEFNRLVKEGTLAYDKASGAWTKAAAPQAVPKPAGESPEDMKKRAEDQKRLEEQLAGDLIKISGDKWTVLRNQAKKHYEDQVKLAHGNNDLIEKAKRVLAGNLAQIDKDQAEEQGKASRAATDKAIRDQKELQTAIIQSQITRMKAATHTALARLDDIFERGEVSVKEYFARRLALIEEEFQKEVAAIQKQIGLETEVAAQLRLQDEIFELQEQHKRNLIQLTQQQAEAEKKVAENAEQARRIMADIGIRTLMGSPDMRDQFQGELLSMDRMHAEEIERLKKLNATKAQLDEAYRQQKLQKDRLLVEQEKRLWEFRLSMAQQIASGISSIFNDLYELSGKKNKEFFYLAKASAIAEAIVNGALAITKALAQGGMWGMAQAAVISAMTGVQIAKIQAQQLAYGGPVLGWSPNKRADNVPAMLTAGEWVQPVDTVRYYGRDIMEALRRRLIPKELFAGFSVPLPSMGPQFAFADGGQVPAGSGAGFVINVPVSVSGARDAEKLGRVLPGEIERTVIRVMKEQLR